MGIQLILISSLCIAISNLCMRRSIDGGGTTKAFLMVQLFLGMLTMILAGPVRTGDYSIHSGMLIFGLACGTVFAGMMSSLGKALENGPPGLTFAILNSSTVMPILLMVILFGGAFGFDYTSWNGIGSVLVIAGLFWAGWETMRSGNMKKWMLFAAGAFAFHCILLVLMQWRALMINFPQSEGVGVNWTAAEAGNEWFSPMIFLIATLIQAVAFFKTEKRMPTGHEVKYGICGGIAQGVGTYFLLWSTEKAQSYEQAMIFPVYAVAIILGCNIWGQWLYKEKVNWKANAFCIFGILIGTVDWKTIFSN